MSFFWIYTCLLLVAVTIGLIKGGWEERVLSITMLVGSYMTAVLYHSTGANWLNLNIPLLVNETVVTALALYVAYKSRYFWPVPFAAMQMMALLTPLAKLFSDNLESHALGVAQGIWAYPQLLMLIWVSLRRKAIAA